VKLKYNSIECLGKQKSLTFLADLKNEQQMLSTQMLVPDIFYIDMYSRKNIFLLHIDILYTVLIGFYTFNTIYIHPKKYK